MTVLTRQYTGYRSEILSGALKQDDEFFRRMDKMRGRSRDLEFLGVKIVKLIQQKNLMGKYIGW